MNMDRGECECDKLEENDNHFSGKRNNWNVFW